MAREIRGTNEWSVSTVNCVSGCKHDCLYCYAKEMAIRFGRKTPKNWKNMEVIETAVLKNYRKRDGQIMCPSSHDITPEVLRDAITVIGKLLKVGNKVLIVTKPWLDCVQEMCSVFKHRFKDQILFRFTIGSTSDADLSFWEPNAPKFKERLNSLRLARFFGFQTSVSSEPFFSRIELERIGIRVLPYITDSWWIGKMNKVRQRMTVNKGGELNQREEEIVMDLEEEYSDKNIKEIYEQFKHAKSVRWKESIKEVVGLPLAERAGEDK